MAKVKLSAMFVTSVQGPLGSCSWKKQESEFVLVKQKYVPGRFSRPFRTHKINPHLIMPNTLYVDCDAWKVADAAYTKLPQDVRQAWRLSIKRPGNSTYDVYMRQAIPHLLRGYPAPNLPTGSTGWPLSKLVYSVGWARFRDSQGCLAEPPPSCETFGLHYLAYSWRKVTVPLDPWYGVKYAIRLSIGYNTGHPKWPEVFYFDITAYDSLEPDGLSWCTENYPWLYKSLIFYSDCKPNFLKVRFYPPKTTPDGQHLLDPGEGTYENSVEVYYLNVHEPFIHWPRFWPSKKWSGIPLDRPLLEVWSDDNVHHYWPREY